jgi:hypothetical protein
MADDAPSPCRWCGEAHGKLCPWVKAYEYDSLTGLIVTRVEFLTPADYGLKTSAADGVSITEPEYPKLGQKTG